MPAKTAEVNLLDHDDFSQSPLGRIVSWATTYGRYIMVTTEIVVLLAFISRFSLDRKLTDLNEQITQKQAIIEANQSFEKDFRLLQEKLSQVKSLMVGQSLYTEVLEAFRKTMPEAVYVQAIEINKEGLTTTGVSATTQGFTNFLANLQTLKQFSEINLGDVKRTNVSGIQFQISAKFPKAKPTQKNTTTQTTGKDVIK